MFYNDPIDDFLEQTRDSARNRTRENRPVSSIEGTPREFRGTGVGTRRAQNEMAIANALFGDSEGLSDSESDRHTELQLESERLQQPNEHRSLGTAASPNNPFSLDTRGLSGAISRGAASFRDRRDERRLDEIAPELRELAQRQQAAAQSSEDRRDYMRDRVTQVIDDEREFDQTVERDEADRSHDREMQELRGDQAIEREGVIGDRMKEVEEYKHQLQNDPENPDNQRMYISGVNNYIKASNPGLELIPNKINNILRASDYNPTDDEQAIIDELEGEYKRQSMRAAQQYRELGAVSGQRGTRPATDEEFNRIATMQLRGVPEDIIRGYASDLGIEYIPPNIEDAEDIDIDLENVDSDSGGGQRGAFDP